MGEYIHLYSGVHKHERTKASLSILIKTKHKKHIKSRETIDERFIKVTILLERKPVTIIGIYTPNDDASIQIKSTFEEYWRKYLKPMK